MAITIIMLRHATRERHSDEVSDEYLELNLPLNAIGKSETRARASQLIEQGIKPNAYFTSYFTHARQTGEILRDIIGSPQSATISDLLTLTPHFQGLRRSRGNWHGSAILESLLQETRVVGCDLSTFETVVFILHQPRLMQLLQVMTSQNQSQFSAIGYSEGVHLCCDSIDALSQGQSKTERFLVSGTT